MKKKFLKLLLELGIALFVCAVLYVFFRPHEVLINRIFAGFYKNQNVIAFLNQVKLFVPSWLIYSFPGALWLHQFLLIFDYYLPARDLKKRVLWSVVPFLFPMTLEIFQYLNLTDGTYDVCDLMWYSFAWSLFVFRITFFNKSKMLINSSYLKLSAIGLSFLVIVVFTDVF